ncbi:MAG: hypothetical protein NHB15_15015 [Methanosarcina barkeri]|nr:hypothetical protein [Methanosarcina sp. ERenArc_MAG2]
MRQPGKKSCENCKDICGKWDEGMEIKWYINKMKTGRWVSLIDVYVPI